MLKFIQVYQKALCLRSINAPNLYINNIASDMSSTCRLFADDCIIYRSIESKDDAKQSRSF